jgi:hypothetical protein
MQLRKMAALHEITDPHYSMWAKENMLFVTNSSDFQKMRTSIFVYSLEDFQLIKPFGGPEMFKIQPAHSVILFFHPDKFAVNSSGKVSLYNYDLELLQEMEHSGDSFFYAPFGDKFIARQIFSENKIRYYRLNLYDTELNFIKEVCRKEFEGKAFSGDFSFEIYKNKLYVANRMDDFLIEVFNEEGSRIKSIAHECSRVKVTQEDKDRHMSRLTNRQGWERYFESREKMEEYFRNLIKYPEYFPAITEIHLDEDNIYVNTRNQVEDTREFWVLNLEGRVKDKKMIPFRMQSLNQCYPYTIKNERLYQLIQNEQTKEWELFSFKLQ